MTGQALDIVVLALLGANLAYCWMLNRRLKLMRDGQASLQSAIADFDAAAKRAGDSIARIEREGATTGKELADSVARAEALQGDLSMMVAAGDRVAQRIEAALGAVRAAGGRR